MLRSSLPGAASVTLLALAAAPLGAAQQALDLTNDSLGTGYVRIADDPGLEPQNITLEAWVRPGGPGIGITTDTAGATIVAKPQEGVGGVYIMSWYLAWRPIDGRFYGVVTHAAPNSGTNVLGTTSVPVGEIAHVALTFDGQELLLYVNGALDGVAQATATGIDYGANDVLIGASNFCCGFLRRFDGTIDEVRVWDHARDGLEIASQSYCRLSTPPAGLLAQWSFESGQLADSSGNGHDGVAAGTGVSFTGGLPHLAGVCDQIGSNYCSPGVPNSSGQPGTMYVFGSTGVADDALILVADQLPPGTFGFFLTSRSQGLTANPGGSQGTLCLRGPIGRYNGPTQVRNTSLGGTFSIRTSLAETPTPFGLVQVLAGESWNFQAWHRDTVGGQTTSNFTDATEVHFN